MIRRAMPHRSTSPDGQPAGKDGLLRRRATRLALRCALGLCGFFALALAATVFAYPAAAAIACPSCYGFRSAGSNVFVERRMTPHEQSRAVALVEEARDRVRGFYGALERAPRILICTSDDCYRRIGGGGSRGMAILDVGLVLSVRGSNPVIAAHELAHVELHGRLGYLRTLRREVPQWFDEGVAVVVSNDPRYLASPDAANRCLVDSGEALPAGRVAWIEGAARHQLYGKAACRVSRWMAARGGPKAVVRLIEAVARGSGFDAAYR